MTCASSIAPIPKLQNANDITQPWLLGGAPRRRTRRDVAAMP
jgi:hypothetical protein